QGRLGQHLGRLLEAGRRDEAVGLHGRLSDAQEHHAARRRGRRDVSRRLPAFAFEAGPRPLAGPLADGLAGPGLGIAGVLDLDALLEAVVNLAEGELVNDRARQQARVPHRLDFHLAEHLRDDVLDVLVVDIDALAAVDALDLPDQVVLDGIDAADA